MDRKFLARVLSLALVLLVCAGLVYSGTAPVQAQAKTTLTYGLSNNVDTLDPNTTTFSSVGQIMAHVVEGLVWEPKLGTYEPGLASEWSINKDTTEYTFKLRKDVKFHDGTPLNAAAVKFTFDRIADPATKAQTAASLLGPYKESVVVDDSTITVRFKSPYSPFLSNAATTYLGIISPDGFKKAGADWGTKTVVGTGPFKVDSYTPDSQVVLSRNADYKWGPKFSGLSGASKLEKIVFKIILEPATRLAALESGEVDIINDTPTSDVKRLKDEKKVGVLQIEQPGSGWSLMMNVEKEPTNDVNVRKAIAMSIDKQGFINSVFDGLGSPGCSGLTKVMFGYDPKSCSYLPFDRAAAGKILDDAGWKMGSDGIRAKGDKKLVIDHHFRSDSPQTVAMSTYVQADLKKAGINVNMVGAARAGYFDAVRAGKHNTQFWWDTNTEADAMIRTLFWSKNADGGTNRNRYKSDKMDKLIDDAAAVSDPAKRAELYAQIQKLAADDAVMAYLNDPFVIYAQVPALQGAIPLGGGNYLYLAAATFK